MSDTTITGTEERELKVYTEEEVQKHNTPQDCWIICHGKVYDVSKWADEHPAGPELITDYAGFDLTDPFDEVNHSTEAHELLETLCVGRLPGSPKTKFRAKSAGATGSSLLGPFVLMTVVIIGVLVHLAKQNNYM
ncbi:cytochrome b5 [Ascobolus immersus RN42]|uniref:Cytochrome b5 n=1 Tax=Ascobolus immersus RN42 TaxID=1160509 RepID=A0A3N4IJY9_ASCIM|nr:cytochrome b5 [Ascobolus immersus RN42]